MAEHIGVTIHTEASNALADGTVLFEFNDMFDPLMSERCDEATRTSVTSIQDLLLNEGIVLDDIYITTRFKTNLSRKKTDFKSTFKLVVVKMPDRRTVAVLNMCGLVDE